ncbi:MAG: hypothetical protein AB1505_18255 [Candidatus Latescibacterota bacterium]
MATPPCLDGVLAEWGTPWALPIVPGGENVGLRGAFSGPEDLHADFYLMWDARFLYAAVAVVDDTTDASRVPPERHVWQGAAGERQDLMFYYDHLKLFVRGVQAPLGCNLWVAPSDGQQPPYAWGWVQRGRPSEQVPAQVGSASCPGTYTYEVALPWEWLGVRPQPDGELDVLALLADADRPGLEVGRRVRQGSRCLWWEGKVRLTGTPPGLPPPPAPSVQEQVAAAARQVVVPEPARASAAAAGARPATVPAGPPPAQAPATPVARAVAAPAPPDASGAVAASGPDAGAAPASASASPATAADLRARLRQSLATPPAVRAPAWVRQLGREQGFSEEGADSLYGRLRSVLCRLASEGVNARSDALILDMAEHVGAWRGPTRAFVVALLGQIPGLLEDADGGLRAGVAAAAQACSIDEGQAVRLFGSLCAGARQAYQTDRVCMSAELVERARGPSDLSPQEARDLLQALALRWRE